MPFQGPDRVPWYELVLAVLSVGFLVFSISSALVSAAGIPDGHWWLWAAAPGVVSALGALAATRPEVVSRAAAVAYALMASLAVFLVLLWMQSDGWASCPFHLLLGFLGGLTVLGAGCAMRTAFWKRATGVKSTRRSSVGAEAC